MYRSVKSVRFIYCEKNSWEFRKEHSSNDNFSRWLMCVRSNCAIQFSFASMSKTLLAAIALISTCLQIFSNNVQYNWRWLSVCPSLITKYCAAYRCANTILAIPSNRLLFSAKFGNEASVQWSNMFNKIWSGKYSKLSIFGNDALISCTSLLLRFRFSLGPACAKSKNHFKRQYRLDKWLGMFF